MMTRFDELLAKVPNLNQIGYSALCPWGYSFEDAGQEALIALWEISMMDAEVTYLSSYIHTMLHRAEIDKYRLNRKYVALSEIREDEAPRAFTGQNFRELTQHLTHARRSLLYLAHVAGYSIKELAERYGVAEGTIKSRMHRTTQRTDISS